MRQSESPKTSCHVLVVAVKQLYNIDPTLSCRYSSIMPFNEDAKSRRHDDDAENRPALSVRPKHVINHRIVVMTTHRQ